MPVDQKKRSFEKPSSFKRSWNRLTYGTRFGVIVMLGVVLVNIDQIRQGLAFGDLENERKMWIVNEMRNLEKNPYSILDEETPP